ALELRLLQCILGALLGVAALVGRRSFLIVLRRRRTSGRHEGKDQTHGRKRTYHRGTSQRDGAECNPTSVRIALPFGRVLPALHRPARPSEAATCSASRS